MNHRNVKKVGGEMVANILTALAVFFVQPSFLVGLALAFMISAQRKKRERSYFHVAIDKRSYEVKTYLVDGLLIGLLCSVLIVAVGIPVTIDWIILYQLIALLMLLFGFRFIHPLFTFSAAVLVLVGIREFIAPENVAFLSNPLYEPFSQLKWVHSSFGLNVLIMSLLVLAGTLIYFKKKTFLHLSPILSKTKRGKKTASYRITPFFVIPLVLIVPGSTFTAFFDWWPVFSIGNQQYAFFILPVLFGFRLVIRGQVVSEAIRKTMNELMIVGILGLLCAAGSYWFAPASLIGSLLLILSGGAVLFRHYRREKKAGYLYGFSNDGLKIIGIKLDTPAQKMELKVGETLVACNDLPLRTIEDFYAALATNSVYCHLKVRGTDGELRLTESALYDDDPYGIGLVFLPDQK